MKSTAIIGLALLFMVWLWLAWMLLAYGGVTLKKYAYSQEFAAAGHDRSDNFCPAIEEIWDWCEK